VPAEPPRPSSPADALTAYPVRSEPAFGEGVATQMRIPYGGSVKPENATALMSQPEIDGALVGGASLNPKSFAAIVKW